MGFITFYWLLILFILCRNPNSLVIYTPCESPKTKKQTNKQKDSFSPFYNFFSFPFGEYRDPHETPKMNVSNYFDLQPVWQLGLEFPHWSCFQNGNYLREKGFLGRWAREWGAATRGGSIRQVCESPSQLLKCWPKSPTKTRPVFHSHPTSPVFSLPEIRKGWNPERFPLP